MRADLLGLSEAALTKLSNVGLVKRATKEVAATPPRIEVREDGGVVCVFADGAVTQLLVGTPLKLSPCTCGASTVCRHRVAAVLAYQAHLGTRELASAARWNPGEIDDDTLRKCCGVATVRRAEALRNTGMVVELVCGSPEQPPTARLPNATVAFLVADDVTFAKCDCQRGGQCEHVVVAVWAFRKAVHGGVVAFASIAQAWSAQDQLAAQTLAIVLCQLAEFGVASGATLEGLALARSQCAAARWLWPALGVAEVEMLGEKYNKQSASFSLETLRWEVAQLVARLGVARAAPPRSPLPVSWVLGTDTEADTAMAQVRLVALGARTFADGEARTVRLYFVDPDTATVLVLDKHWDHESRVGEKLGQLFASSKLSVASLAQGELVTRAAKRKANGALDLATARGMQTSLLPSDAGWRMVPAPVRVTDLAQRKLALAQAAPPMLSPRAIASGFAVVEIGTVGSIEASPDGQHVVAYLQDRAGNDFVAELWYRSVAPGAVTALCGALGKGPYGIAGELRMRDGVWHMEPVSVFVDRVIALDLQPATHAAPPEPRTYAPPQEPKAAPDAFVAFRAGLDEFIGRTLLRGLRNTAAAAAPLATTATLFGLGAVADRLKRCHSGHADALLELALLCQWS